MTVGVDMSGLQIAAVGMLEPLMRSGADGDLGSELGDAIDHCARTARESDVRSIGYLSAIVVPYLRKGGLSPQDAHGRELVETWLNDLFAFCVGQLPPSRVRVLVDQLVSWPRLQRLPDEFSEMIVERLQRDALTLAPDSLLSEPSRIDSEPSETAQAETALPGSGVDQDTGASVKPSQPIPGGATVPSSESDPDALEIEGASTAAHPDMVELARDELDLLAGEVRSIEERMFPALLATSTSAHGPSPSPTEAQLEWSAELAVELGQISAALGVIGHERLQRALDRVVENLRSSDGHTGEVAERHHRALVELPTALRAYFAEPGSESVQPLLLALAPWHIGSGDDHGLADALLNVRVVASRRVSHREELDDSDETGYLLSVPEDADPSVLQQLRRELPRLCEEFALAVDAVRAGRLERLADAQRIAHTLKGAANTAGIRAIAILTHELEDVLQLLHNKAARPEPELCDWLERAADALSELNEALSGLGPAPSDLREVHAALIHWVNRLLTSDGAAAEAPAALPAAMPAQRALPVSPGSRGESEESAREEGVDPLPDTAAAEGNAGDREILQVPTTLVERILDTISEAAIKIAQMQDHISQVDATRLSLRNANEGLQNLSGELERLVDVRGVAVTARSGTQEFDPLELDEYNDLHTVSRRIAEAGADQRIIDRSLGHHLLELKALSDQVERLQVDLQDLAHRTRMIAVRSIAPRLRRAVRQAARMSGKSVELVVRGEQTELDGEILDLLVDSLAHLLRNAVDHGIEDGAGRAAAGKPEVGQIVLQFSRDAAHVRIECLDDGAGIDRTAVIERARAQGLLAPDAIVGDDTWAALILAPGLSTRREVTQLSGRGIGLDVVNQAIRRLRGRLSVASEAGKGSRFLIEIPVKVSSRPVMIVVDARYCLAVTAQDIEEILPSRALTTDQHGQQVALTGHGPVPVRHLSEMLGLPPQVFAAELADSMLLVVRHGQNRLAVVTPALTQARNVMVRSLPAWVPSGAGVAGLAVLGEGSVAPVLDLPALLDSPGDPAASYSNEVALEHDHQPLCLVVDDSVSVRRSMELFLQDLGLRVVTASDGLQALDRARRQCPALVIVDLEMPRMNGIEFAKAFRADAQFSRIPIIMITSRFSQKHRKRALEAGVNAFMTKPYTEDAVASEIQRWLLRSLD